MNADNPSYDKLLSAVTQPLAMHAAVNLWDATTLYDLAVEVVDAIWPEIEKYLPKPHTHRWVANDFGDRYHCEYPLCQEFRDGYMGPPTDGEIVRD